MLLRASWAEQEIYYATTLEGLAAEAGVSDAFLVTDCNRNEKWAIVRSFLSLLVLLARLRPHVVVTTGALPGLLAIMIGRAFGARTVWIDSIANAEEMSLAGLSARRFADLWLTQWAHVAAATGAEHAGSVL